MSLEIFYYDKFQNSQFYTDDDAKRQKYRILIPKGLNCRPRFPVNYDYAKGLLVMHIPWSTRHPLTDLLIDEQKTIDNFLEMIKEHKLPVYVVSEFHHAVR